MGRSSTAAGRPTTVNISSWGTPEEGIYIDTMICSKPISMLVDTGASVTILSLFQENPFLGFPQLVYLQSELYALLNSFQTLIQLQFDPEMMKFPQLQVK
jgi:hypothetical protein